MRVGGHGPPPRRPPPRPLSAVIAEGPTRRRTAGRAGHMRHRPEPSDMPAPPSGRHLDSEGRGGAFGTSVILGDRRAFRPRFA